MSDLIRLFQAVLATPEYAAPRYRFRFNKKASACLRRAAFPHKWRGLSRSHRHLRSVKSFLNTIEHAMNTADVYQQIDAMMAERLRL